MDTNVILKKFVRQNIPELRSGQVVRVYEKIIEGGKERVQVFEGLIIAVKHGRGLDGTFTVRKIATGHIGVERTFVLHMPAIQRIEILRQEKVRRSKLYFVRGQVNKKTRKRQATEVNRMFEIKEIVEEQVEENTEEEIEESVEQEVQEVVEQKVEEKTSETTDKAEDKTEEKVEKEVKENVKEKVQEKEAMPQD